MKLRIHAFLIGLLLAALVSACGVEKTPPTITPKPPTPAPDLSVLVVGHSLIFNNQWPKYHLERFFEEGDPPLVVDLGMHYEGGSRIEHMWGVEEIHEKIDKGYDYLVISPHSSGCFEEKESFYTYTRMFYDEAQEYGTELVLYMPWLEIGREDDFQKVLDAHVEIASELGIKIAPVGLAYFKALDEYPELELVIEDGHHPNGSMDYLSLCVLYATITGNSPVGNPYISVPEDQAVLLQQIAWDTVEEYQK